MSSPPLPRSLSLLSALGLSFAIMAVPFGLSTTLYITLTDGQAVAALWGWVCVSCVSLCMAASLAEICAVYPTAGGVYYWSAMMAGDTGWEGVVGWVAGWVNLVGNWTVTLSINFSGAQLILSAITLWREDFRGECVADGVDVLGRHAGIYWTASSVIILVTLLSMADQRRSAAFVFGHYDASASGWPTGWAFFVGLLQAAYTQTGYGLIASMCEEVPNPSYQVPRAMVLSVAAAGVTGVVYLIPLLFVLPDVAFLLHAAGNQPIGLLFKTVTGSAGGGFGLLFLLLGILFFAGTGALTAASRCAYAFARDGAVPGGRWMGRTDGRLGIPLWGLVGSTAVICALGLIYFGSTAAFNSFTGVATICLNCGYGLPILVSVLRGRRVVKESSFSLGRFGYAINCVCLAWICLAVVLFSMPVSLPVTASTMNYASVVFMGFASISLGYYLLRGRKTFTGPPVRQEDDPSLEGIDDDESTGNVAVDQSTKPE